MSSGRPPYDVSLIDGFELRCGATVIEVPRACQRLIAFLALRERPVLRSFVSGTLWADSDSEHANASLRSALWRVPSPHTKDVVVATSTHLSLREDIRVDYRDTVTWARGVLTGTGSGEPAHAWTFREIAVLGGDVLPDWYDEWVLTARERFRQLRLHALESLCDQLARAGRFGEALQAGLDAIAVEPLRESAHRRVIAVHLQEGNRVEALRQYRTYERLIRDELSLEPSQELTAMVRPALQPATTA